MGTNTGLVLLALFLCNFNYCTVSRRALQENDNGFTSPQAFRLKFTNMICESFNNSWVTYKECRLRAISRNKTTLNAVVFITEPAYDISVRLQVLKKANGYKPWVMDYTVDCCKFMRQQYHPVGKIVWTLIKDFSSFNHTCPYVVRQEKQPK